MILLCKLSYAYRSILQFLYYFSIATELLPGKTVKEVKKFLKNYLTAAAKEVQSI